MRRRKLSEKIIASALCAVMAFGNVNVSTIFASETADPSIEVASEVTAEQESAPVADEPVLMTAEEPEEAPLVEPEPTEVITPEPTPETVVEPQPTEEALTAEPKPTEAAPETVKEPAEEPKAPETTPVTEETVTEEDEEVLNEEVLNEAVQLKKEFQDGYGNHIRITADIQAESFQAEASAITMEVKGLSPSEDTYMQNMIEEKLPEDMVLGDYIFYDIAFKVNGQVTEPMKAIRITFAGNKLPVEDTEKANVVYLDYADPTIPGDKNEIVEIPQKKDLVKAGWTAAQIEEQDVSEIFMNADGTADQIQMEGNDSTIYGCYVEKEPQLVFTHEDDDVKITVSAEKKGIIPEGVSLNVVPILKDAAETTEKYSEVEAQLQKKQKMKNMISQDSLLTTSALSMKMEKRLNQTAM